MKNIHKHLCLSSVISFIYFIYRIFSLRHVCSPVVVVFIMFTTSACSDSDVLTDLNLFNQFPFDSASSRPAEKTNDLRKLVHRPPESGSAIIADGESDTMTQGRAAPFHSRGLVPPRGEVAHFAHPSVHGRVWRHRPSDLHAPACEGVAWR